MTFTVVLVSAVLSSVDSGILAPAAVLSENVLRYVVSERVSSLVLNRLAVLLVGLGSVAMAYAGESAYSLLEQSYEVALVCLFVPISYAVYGGRGAARSAIASMLLGLAIWLLHLLAGWESFAAPWTDEWPVKLPVSVVGTLASLGAYLCFVRAETTSSS